MSDKARRISPVCSSRGCGANIEVPSKTEVEALSAMRSIKLRVRELKRQIKELRASQHEKSDRGASILKKELAELKSQWGRWEGRRARAARERMILLGHERDDSI
jgi:chromosome segregation ATPase